MHTAKKIIINDLIVFTMLQSTLMTSYAGTVELKGEDLKYEVQESTGYKYTYHGIVTHDYNGEACPVDANGNGNGYVNYQKPGTELVYVPAYNQEVLDARGIYRAYRDALKSDGKFHVNSVMNINYEKQQKELSRGDSLIRNGFYFDFFRGNEYFLDAEGNRIGAGIVKRISYIGKEFYFMIDDRPGENSGVIFDGGEDYCGITIDTQYNEKGERLTGYLDDATIDKICALKGITRADVPVVERWTDAEGGGYNPHHIANMPWKTAGYTTMMTEEGVAFADKEGFCFFWNYGEHDSDVLEVPENANIRTSFGDVVLFW